MASQHKQVLPARLRLLRILAFFLVAFLCGWNLYHRSLFARRGNRTMVDLPYGLWSEKQPGISTLGPGEISWYPCVPASKNVECGSILVPKNYSNLSAGTAAIALAIYRAKPRQGLRKGSVFLNPGGPGAPGTHLTLNTGQSFAKLIGDDWDLVGFDPRGVGSTRPETRCFETEQEYDNFFSGSVVELGLEVSSIANLTTGTSEDEAATRIYGQLVPQYQGLLELKRSQADLCQQRMGNELKYMSTTTVVKDLDFISKILDQDIPDSKINYWGESYGSIIGAYLVNMLPERAGYVVVDGIVDPVSWSNEPTHQWSTHWLADAEKTYEKFLSDCSKAGPPLCPLALHEGEPWRNIESRFEEFFDRLAREPMRVNSIGGRQGRPSSNDEGERRQGVLTSGAARGLLESFLYNPQRWPEAAQLYSSAFKGDAEGLYNHIRPPPFNSSSRTTSIPSHSHSLPTRRDLHRQAITCLDSPPSSTPPSAEELARIGLYNLRNVSPHFGVSLAMNVLEPDIGCEFWPVHIGAREEREANRGEGKENTINERQSLPERFSGPWGLGKGKTPGPGSDTELERRMVIISNTADPITPLSGGLHLNALMPDSSVIVIQDGPGHCSNGLPSVCTAKLVRGYFSGTGTGTSTNPNADKDGIPFNGTICTPDMLTFPDPRRSIDGIESVMWSLMSEEDRTLLRAVRDIRRGYEDG